MTLEEFAKLAGVELKACDARYGGSIGWTTVDSPSSQVCGFKSNAAAYKSWFLYTFEPQTAKAIRKLLKASEK